jgi:diacylglycerol kinase (ATP)
MRDVAAGSTAPHTDRDTGLDTGQAPLRAGAVAVVINPVKVDDVDALTAQIADRCAALGLPAPTVLPTTEDDPGLGQARQAVQAGARVVIAAGGDGTVRAVAEGLTGTGTPLGVLPQGTGNLLARNLELPSDLPTAIEVALGSSERTIDVGRLDDGTVFAVMAGAGFDAAMMRDAPEGLKSAVGWPAYLVGGIRSLRRDRVRIELRLNDQPRITARVRTVLIANLGKLQGGLELLPDARPDDGRLDVCLVSPRRLIDWLVILVRAILRNRRTDHRMQCYSAERVQVRLLRGQPRQVDGDLIGSSTELNATVVPGGLIIRVPEQNPPDGR